jgi:hypothetical protein
MEGSTWRDRDWLLGSPRFRPDWRLRRAEYLLATRGRLNHLIDDQLIKQTRTHLAKMFRRNGNAKSSSTTIQSVHDLSRSDSPRRWRLEAFLLTDLPYREISETLHLSPEFIAMYHDLAFEVRPRRRATDWLTCHAMSRGNRPNIEHAWKTIARAGGSMMLEVAIAITTGSPFPEWMQQTFRNPKLDDAILRMRGKLMIGAMVARTREQWRALVSLRRKLRRLVPTPKHDKGEARLQAMLTFLAGATSNANPLDENQPIRAPEPLTFATMTPGDPSSQIRSALRENVLFRPAAESVQCRRRSRGHDQQAVDLASQDPEEVAHEFMTEGAEATGPLAFTHIEIDEAKWSAFDDESEAPTVTVSIHT